ncbi:hypothetical protein [Rossellomorea marisflavi]|uniref:hypothetical protein n=1 Tax=Rossellomorea marisflavi TaxID=189381 RepID=UPI003FA05720
MKKTKWFKVKPNIVNYLERGEEGLDLHYASNRPLIVYVGKQVIYKRKERMNVIRNAWSLNPGELIRVKSELTLFCETPLFETSEFNLTVKGVTIPLRGMEALFLREEIEFHLPILQKEMVQDLYNKVVSPEPLLS